MRFSWILFACLSACGSSVPSSADNYVGEDLGYEPCAQEIWDACKAEADAVEGEWDALWNNGEPGDSALSHAQWMYTLADCLEANDSCNCDNGSSCEDIRREADGDQEYGDCANYCYLADPDMGEYYEDCLLECAYGL